MIRRLFIALALLSCWSGAAWAEVNWREVQSQMARAVRSPSFVENVLDTHGLTGMPRRVLKDHLIALYARDEVLAALVREMRLAGLDRIGGGLGAREAHEWGRRFGSELFVSYAIKGLQRLPAQDQRQFLRYLSLWMSLATPTDCKKLLDTGANASAQDSAALEMKYYGRFREEELRSYFAVMRKGLLAQINGYPSAKELNDQQVQIADGAFEQELERKFKAGLVRREVMEALLDIPNAPPQAACDAGRLLFDTAVEMRGFAGELLVQKIIGAMQ